MYYHYQRKLHIKIIWVGTSTVLKGQELSLFNEQITWISRWLLITGITVLMNMVLGFLEAILLNDSESEIISLDKMYGELILTCRLVNVRKQFILEVGLRKSSDFKLHKFCHNSLHTRCAKTGNQRVWAQAMAVFHQVEQVNLPLWILSYEMGVKAPMVHRTAIRIKWNHM